MSFDTFAITPIQVISWIILGFVAALVITKIRPSPNRSVVKDIVLGMVGSLTGGLTIIFIYGYLLLEVFVLSLVAGIILASFYIAFWHTDNTHPSSPIHHI